MCFRLLPPELFWFRINGSGNTKANSCCTDFILLDEDAIELSVLIRLLTYASLTPCLFKTMLVVGQIV
jgi:hypothetical protein